MADRFIKVTYLLFFISLCFSTAFAFESPTIKRLVKAAENGNSEAMIALAFMYTEGENVTKNIDKAIEWYKKAAQAGSTEC